MWIDDEGGAHTAALPDPATLMSEEFRTSFDALVSAQALVRTLERTDLRWRLDAVLALDDYIM